MKRNQIIQGIGVLSFLAFISSGFAQEKEAIVPFKIEDRLLSGMDIPKLKLKAHPDREYFQKRIYQGSELSVFILSSETAVNDIPNFPIDEFVYFLNGRADIEPKDDKEFSFFAGDYIFVPKGFSGKWINNGGNTYHLELSVISNTRSDSTAISKAKIPFVLNKDRISGIQLTQLGSKKYKDVLYHGVELEVTTESEISCEMEIVDQPKEEFIHVLAGVLTITPKSGTTQTFYRGDFFVLPKGFTGHWKSEGHDLCRTLRVKQI
ncbi:cupin domain-containing protein [Aquimarina spongiae]|uniref:(S)-ureidoglycine aminohydrolase cupin domain-containing protein n=1 Tax=Aquimarina spongiae TaxID=570521 RepID=A0A1M6CEM6_9FLAO|nr:cupin domain-containing protein [Aquimarina spongiae]SHI59301.1 Protein of unknown function [Aquimarina spongiae]